VNPHSALGTGQLLIMNSPSKTKNLLRSGPKSPHLAAGGGFEYAFDHIGNRRTNRFGGDEAGLSLQESRYTVSELNQYSSRTVSGYVNVLGEATNKATVRVNTNLAYRKDRYFRAEFGGEQHTDNPVWLGDHERGVAGAGREQLRCEHRNRACVRAQNAGNLHV